MLGVEERILEVLRRNWPLDKSTREIAREAGVSPPTASKYLAVLLAQGKVEVRRIGSAKLWRLRRKR